VKRKETTKEIKKTGKGDKRMAIGKNCKLKDFRYKCYFILSVFFLKFFLSYSKHI
jgi:hypothetical protein